MALAAAEALFPIGALGERNRVEHLRALVAKHREGAPDRAGRFVLAVAARRVIIDARAGHEGDRPFHRADNLAERDLVRFAGEPVAALGAAYAFDQARPSEVEHDQLEIFGRDALR